MRKGDPVEEVLVAPMTSVQVYIDQDDVALWRVCRFMNGMRVCDAPGVISMGPVTEIVGARLPGSSRIAVAYLKIGDMAYVRKGQYSSNGMCWADEMTESDCWAEDLWPLRN